MADEVIRVSGLTELLHGLRAADAGLYREVRKSIIEAGEVVKTDAQNKAGAEISNIGPVWSRMRLGMSGASAVYVAPASRRKAGHGASWARPNLARLLLDKAMIPAADEGRPIVEERVIGALEDLHANAGLISHLHAL